MQLTALFFLTAGLTASATGFSQKVTLSEKNAPLGKVFQDIKKQTGYEFLYTDEMLKGASPITFDLQNADLTDALAACFHDQPFTYTIIENTVVVKPKPTGAFQPPVLISPPGDVHGHVTDSLGYPLVGASVTVQGMKKAGALTDEKGNFELKGVDPNELIIISYTGYGSKQIRLHDRTSIEIVLSYSNSPLDKAQVIAYGTQTQRFSVGSVSTVTAADIASQPVSNPLEALEGRVPGLIVSQTSGVSGSSVSVQIRGQNSIFQGSDPLYIIDGVPFAPQNAEINQISSFATSMGPFNSINPADIESIEVLRDADATAIYGSLGANGVILITTKRGKAGKTKFNANVWSGESSLTKTMPLMNTQQYLAMRHEGIDNDGVGSLVTPAYGSYFFDLLGYDTTMYTNFKKQFFGTSHVVDGNVSVSGGVSNIQFLVGTGYHRETSIVPGDFADNRGSINQSFTYTSTDRKFSLDLSSIYSFEQNDMSGSGSALYQFAVLAPPDAPKLLDSGNLVWYYNGYETYNPLQYLREPYSLQNENLLSHLQVGYKIFPGFTLKSSFGYNTFSANETLYEPSTAQEPYYGTVEGAANFGTNNFRTWIIEPQAEYNKIIARGKMDFLMGGTFQQNTNSSTNIYASDYSSDALLGSISAAGKTTISDGYSQYRYNAFFGRLNYIWHDEYILNLTGRRDGSSRFGPGRQFGNFGAIGGGWIFTEEPGMKNILPFLDFGKLRGSYGITGGQPGADYQYQANWQSTQGNQYQGQTGLIPKNLFNPDFNWEVNKKLEGGLELGMFKDKIVANITLFRNRCGNQLINYPLPAQSGFSSVLENSPALVQNSGWELQLNATPIKSRKFKWDIAFNMTIPKNKLLAYPDLSSSSYASQLVIGKSLSTYSGFKLLGVNDSTGLYEFANSSGKPTTAPVSFSNSSNLGDWRFNLGNTDPKFFGGLKNSFRYSGFTLDIFLEFRKQMAQNYLDELYFNGQYPGTTTNMPTAVLGRWQRPGDKASIEQFTAGYEVASATAAEAYCFSDGAYSSASYVRFKNISLGWNLPDGDAKKLKLEAARIYINAQNLFTLTHYMGNDPETHNYFGMPPLKTITAGIQLTL